MSTNQMLVVVLFLLLVGVSYQLPCSGGEDCSLIMQRLYNAPYKRRDQYDFVRFGKRSEAQKKGGYEYVRFGKRAQLNWAL